MTQRSQRALLPVFICVLFASGFAAAAQAQWLRVSNNHRFLEKDNGAPFFYLADTAWEFFERLSREQADYYLRNRAGKGFDVIQAVLIGELNGPTVPNAEGQLPLINMDPDHPNEKYFELVDHDIHMAARYGIYMAVLPTWGSWVEDKPHPLFENHDIFTPENAYQYGFFLGQRYAHDWNIIWVLGGDRPPTGHMEVWDALAKGLRAGDGGRHLITYHPPGEASSSQFFQGTPLLDFNMIQVGHARFDNMDAEFVTHDYNLKPVKPTVDGETTYEDHPCDFNVGNPRFSSYDVRKAAYWAVFAGAMGHTYGNNNLWQMYRKGDVPINGANQVWVDALDSPGSFQMAHLRHLVESRPYFSRIPDQSLILPDAGAIGHDSDRIQITRDGTAGKDDATYIFAYLPIERSIRLNTKVINSESLRAWWFDPRTGDAFPLGVFSNSGSFSPSWNDRVRPSQGGPDWVLVIDDATKQYGPPGQQPWTPALHGKW